MASPLLFSGSPIDRVDQQRRDPAWIEAQLEREETRYLALWRLQVLVRQGAEPALAWARGGIRQHMNPRVGAVLLGLRDGIAHVALDVSGLERPEAALEVDGLARFEDVRGIAPRLPAAEAAIVAQARSQVDWHARHTWCPACGGGTAPRAGGAHRVCETCDAEHFPRTDPVAIALVARGERCLLGRQAGWPARLYSALAGFVTAGETVEEAVRREVAEESGVRVGRVRYLASQPWPFPASLMIGCLAEGLSEAIEVDRGELADARWFGRDEVGRALDGDASGQGLALPPPMAIANFLLRSWASGEG